MLVGILAGGLGTRLSERIDLRPKPMVEIGGRPVLWYLMKIYAGAGFDEVAVALGYRGEMIKDFFLHYRHRTSDLTIRLGTGEVEVGSGLEERWTVRMCDTGLEAQTGERVARLMELNRGEAMMLANGDVVSDIDLRALTAFHRAHGKLATVTAVRPPSRYGELRLAGDRVEEFAEKPQTTTGWINAGFSVLEPGVADYIEPDRTGMWEHAPMERLATGGELMAYRHDGFWQPMDTLRDVRVLEQMWNSGAAPWKCWS